jgi:hypothetical protein
MLMSMSTFSRLWEFQVHALDMQQPPPTELFPAVPKLVNSVTYVVETTAANDLWYYIARNMVNVRPMASQP